MPRSSRADLRFSLTPGYGAPLRCFCSVLRAQEIYHNGATAARAGAMSQQYRRADARKLNGEIGIAITAPKLTERLAALGAEPVVKTPAAFAQYVRDEIVKSAKIVRESGARLD